MPESLHGWGRMPVLPGQELGAEDLEAASRDARLFRGLGRSYGDSSLPADAADRVVHTRRADRVLAFDAQRGVLRAEAGLSLRALNRLLRPHRLASPVQPGTEFVTLGGMVASDVHGGNHHVAGCFGEHVLGLRLRVADGRVLEISDDVERELFRATLGGMGLTGHILEVRVQLERIASPWFWQEVAVARDLDELVDTLRAASRAWPYTKAWVDCTSRGASLGRGFVLMGRWATAQEARPADPRQIDRLGVPFTLPDFTVSRPTVRVFNAFWYRLHARNSRGVVHPQAFFFPLDAVRDWNRLYGPSGFSQYQCVLPLERDPRAYRRLFEVFARMSGASPVSVIKDCGPQGRGLLSFPMEGISIALDVPMRGERTQRLVDRMNEIVIEAGGRVYLTKDSLTRREHFLAMEPRFPAWNEIRHKWDPEGRLRSAQSRRLFGDPA